MTQLCQKMDWRSGPKSILTKLLGLLLLVTAGLKVHGLITDPYGQDNFLALPWLQVLTIEVEVLLGLWLLSKLQPQLGWCVTLLFFAILAAISFTLATQGQTNCGCFGKIEVNPWATLARLRGETLAVTPAVTQLGQGTAGEHRAFKVLLSNYSDKPIKVVGGTGQCTDF